jgi:hypothetical protein
MEPVLLNVYRISRHSQLCNAHTNVDVGRVAMNENEYRNPNHFNISYLRNPKPFVIFGFTFMQLITLTLILVASSFCFVI